MDTAKGCNFLLTNGGRMQDFWGTGKAATQWTAQFNPHAVAAPDFEALYHAAMP